MTRNQYERIKDNSKIKGFNTLSSFLRYVALERDNILERKLFEIHRFLLGGDAEKKWKKQSP
jgi:hypothetical protein